MAIPTVANSSAEARGQSPAVIPMDDGVTRYDQFLPLPIQEMPNGQGQDFYRAPNDISRRAEFPIAFTVRPWDKTAQYFLNGDHGEVVRVQGTPVGALIPFGGFNRAVVRPVPNAWDSGYWTDNLQVSAD